MGTQHNLRPKSHDKAFPVFSTKIFNVIAVFLAPVFNKNSNAKESRSSTPLKKDLVISSCE